MTYKVLRSWKQGTKTYAEVSCNNCGHIKTGVLANLVRSVRHKCCNWKASNRTKHPLYDVWWGMLQRCLNTQHVSYARYGGRGITVHRAWQDSFDVFLADCPTRPSTEHQLDRKDNDGNYTPDNIRWATASEQANNRVSTVRRRWGGKQVAMEVRIR